MTFVNCRKFELKFSTGDVVTRVVSSEISIGKFPEIYFNLSGNFRKFINYLCQSAVSNLSIAR